MGFDGVFEPQLRYVAGIVVGSDRHGSVAVRISRCDSLTGKPYPFLFFASDFAMKFSIYCWAFLAPVIVALTTQAAVIVPRTVDITDRCCALRPYFLAMLSFRAH